MCQHETSMPIKKNSESASMLKELKSLNEDPAKTRESSTLFSSLMIHSFDGTGWN